MGEDSGGEEVVVTKILGDYQYGGTCEKSLLLTTKEMENQVCQVQIAVPGECLSASSTTLQVCKKVFKKGKKGFVGAGAVPNDEWMEKITEDGWSEGLASTDL